ncbi:CS1-pili formation C-terminal domain-containing protein [Vibrio sp. TRT 17S01]|uniref:CS1-pili formation C-terminal domain-containing protein n=1 Tax=Vibrio sp. TRT 17S01 TaxID=3418505 RepID=UPI003CEFD8F4
MNMKLSLLLFTAVFSAGYPTSSSVANEIPEGFEELFREKLLYLDFQTPNGEFKKIEAFIKFGQIRVADARFLNSIRDVYIEQGVTKTFAQRFVEDLQSGVNFTDQCTTLLKDCILPTNDYEVAYDEFNNQVYVWLGKSNFSEDFLKPLEDMVYADGINRDRALINHFDMYLSQSNDFNYSFYNQSLLGLKYGYISTDIEYSSSAGFKTDEALYRLNSRNKKFDVGYSRYYTSFNSTDFLQKDYLNNGTYSVKFGSSNELLLGDVREYQKHFFYSPTDGLLLIKRGEKILLQQNVVQGQGYFTNAQLPSGRYDVDVIILANGVEVLNEKRTIQNSSFSNLLVKDYDYLLEVGRYAESTDSMTMKGPRFGRASVSYRALDTLTLGASLNVTDYEDYAVIGGSYQLNQNFAINSVYTLFSDESNELFVSSNIMGLDIAYESFRYGEGSALEGLLTTPNDYRYISASYGASFNGGSGYLSYTYNIDELESGDLVTQKLDLNVNLPFFVQSRLDLFSSYDFNDEKAVSDRFTLGMNLTLPLNDSISYSHYSGLHPDGAFYSSNSASMETELVDDEIRARASILDGTFFDNGKKTQSIRSGTVGLDQNSEHYKMSLYGYANNKQSRNANLALNSSQIVTKDRVKVTSQKADSYLVVDTDNNIRLKDNKNKFGILQVNTMNAKGKENLIHSEGITDESFVQTLPEYKNIKVKVETSSLSLNNEGNENYVMFSYPGTVAIINTKITRTLTFVTMVTDIFEKDITTLKCVGDGCIDIQEVISGVYKVSVKEGSPFKLQAENSFCLLPDLIESENLNMGTNKCLPDIYEIGQYLEFDEDRRIYYIGRFKESDFDKFAQQIRANNPSGEIIKTKVGKSVVVHLLAEKYASVNVNGFDKYASDLRELVDLNSVVMASTN